MAFYNENFKNLKQNYLFIDIGKKIKAFTDLNPDKPLIRMGIGDVTRPLAPSVVKKFASGVEEMGRVETFRGYEDSGKGYEFLREAVSKYYSEKGVNLKLNEIFISDGAKSDSGNIGDIFSADNKVLVTDPVYPVYVDTNIMAGREIISLNSTRENNFAALPDFNLKCDLIYLCSPNNPTGSVYTKEQLSEWVRYASENKAVIIFDAAYEAFITDPSLPKSIFEIDGARKVALEICSFSKTAGFTGTRCGYTIIPEELEIFDIQGKKIRLNDIWSRRQGSKFNGVSYPVQCAAAAVFDEEAKTEIAENLSYYRKNAKAITDTLDKLQIYYTGGKHSPYVWLKTPKSYGSWEFFDYLLNEIQVVGTPGVGFGKNGEGYFRLTAFSTYEKTVEAMARLEKLLSK